MRRKIVKLTAFLAVFSLLAGLWFWRYQAVQEKYRTYYRTEESVYYEMGEFVTMGPCNAYKMRNIEGYSFRVDDYRLVDYSTYLTERNMADPLAETGQIIPNKLMLVTLTVRNDDNHVEKDYWTTGFSIHSVDLSGSGLVTSITNDLFLALNPELEDSVLFLELGEEVTITLPYGLNREYFSDWTWHHLKDYQFSISVSEVNDGHTIRRTVKLH
ncbi:MAG: hypothetical protein IJB11_00480 [Oscillospiraceae bacterium]|nr:hypothetical protein [Oscillospiraceae bacterium]